MEVRSFLFERSHWKRICFDRILIVCGLSFGFRETSILLVLPQLPVENLDRWDEVVALDHHQVDVVEVLAAAEAVGKIVAWIDCRTQFFAAGTEESKVAIAMFRRWTVAAEPHDRELHGQVVADRSESFRRDHGAFPIALDQ